MDRRRALKTFGAGAAALAIPGTSAIPSQERSEPNIILCMSDDQGRGDTGYSGHPVLQTPALEKMAADGIRFDRWYAAAPVCSPTRGSCLTGRHPYRYGIYHANVGHMPQREVTLAEALKKRGYATGFFGKWHLGTLTKTVKDSNRGGPRGEEHYAPPWRHGFDRCFATEAKVPTRDPMVVPEGWRDRTPGSEFGTYYWNENGERVTDNLEGDDSRVMMDRVIPFIEKAAQREQPFLAVVWFHAPHKPVRAEPRHRQRYPDCSDYEKHYYGCITAMDEQMGRLRQALRRNGVEHNTMLWFCSDNGPEVGTPGSTGPFRGRKRSLYEGGIRVPSVLVWPDRIDGPRRVTMPCCTSDYYPTVLEALDLSVEDQPRPLDGISLMPLIHGHMQERPEPIGFESRQQVSLSDNRYKLYSDDAGDTFKLFDLLEDPGETTDLAEEKPEVLARMKTALHSWRQSISAEA